jgi:hypothetical protein
MKTEHTFTVSLVNIVHDPTSVLFDLNVRLHAVREETKKKMLGKSVSVGDFRGKVVEVSGGKVLLRNNVAEKKFVITEAMLDQIGETTMRK